MPLRDYVNGKNHDIAQTTGNQTALFLKPLEEKIDAATEKRDEAHRKIPKRECAPEMQQLTGLHPQEYPATTFCEEGRGFSMHRVLKLKLGIYHKGLQPSESSRNVHEGFEG